MHAGGEEGAIWALRKDNFSGIGFPYQPDPFSPEFTPFSQIQCIALLAALNSGSDWIERDKTVMMDPLGAKSHFWQP